MLVIVDRDGTPVQYEAIWQVLDDKKGKGKGRGRWVYRRVADRPEGSPNLQPGLLPQELGLITAESMRLNQQIVRDLRSLSADALLTRQALAELAARMGREARAKQQGQGDQGGAAPTPKQQDAGQQPERE